MELAFLSLIVLICLVCGAAVEHTDGISILFAILFSVLFFIPINDIITKDTKIKVYTHLHNGGAPEYTLQKNADGSTTWQKVKDASK